MKLTRPEHIEASQLIPGVLRTWRAVAAVAVILTGCGERQPAETYAALTAEESGAVAIAERFIAMNGYTVAIPDPKQIRPELLERSLPPSVVWQFHHDTLVPKAYGISPGAGASKSGWTVFFETTHGGEYLRAVEMSTDGSQAWMCHYDLRFDSVRKVLRGRSKPRSTGDPGGRRTRG